MVRLILAAASIAVLASPLAAAPCRDAKTKKFIKCAPAAGAMSTAPAVTKDAKGKCHVASGPKKGAFTKCPTP